MSSFSRRQCQSFALQGAKQREELSQITVTLGADTTKFCAAKSPAKSTRLANEHGTGYIQRNVATFLTSSLRPTRPALGDEFTITEDVANPDNVGTVWRTFDLTLGTFSEQDRCVCFRLD